MTAHRQRIARLEKEIAPPTAAEGSGKFLIYDADTGETVYEAPLADGCFFECPDNGRCDWERVRSERNQKPRQES